MLSSKSVDQCLLIKKLLNCKGNIIIHNLLFIFISGPSLLLPSQLHVLKLSFKKSTNFITHNKKLKVDNVQSLLLLKLILLLCYNNGALLQCRRRMLNGDWRINLARPKVTFHLLTCYTYITCIPCLAGEPFCLNNGEDSLAELLQTVEESSSSSDTGHMGLTCPDNNICWSKGK